MGKCEEVGDEGRGINHVVRQCRSIISGPARDRIEANYRPFSVLLMIIQVGDTVNVAQFLSFKSITT